MSQRGLALRVAALASAVAVGAFVFTPPQSGAQEKAQPKVKWEYKLMKGEPDEKKMNELGEEGWELVKVTGGYPYVQSTNAPNAAGTRHNVDYTSRTHYFRRQK